MSSIKRENSSNNTREFEGSCCAGGLVKKILGTKKELDQQPAKKTEIVRITVYTSCSARRYDMVD